MGDENGREGERRKGGKRRGEDERGGYGGGREREREKVVFDYNSTIRLRPEDDQFIVMRTRVRLQWAEQAKF